MDYANTFYGFKSYPNMGLCIDLNQFPVGNAAQKVCPINVHIGGHLVGVLVSKYAVSYLSVATTQHFDAGWAAADLAGIDATVLFSCCRKGLQRLWIVLVGALVHAKRSRQSWPDRFLATKHLRRDPHFCKLGLVT